jgi:chromosome segregation and condensation protein ScpB
VAQPVAHKHTGQASYGQRNDSSSLQEAASVWHKHIGQQQRQQLKTAAASTAAYVALETIEQLRNIEDYDLSLEACNKTLSELLSKPDRKQAAASRKLAEDVDQHAMLRLVQVSTVWAPGDNLCSDSFQMRL